jgi:hypothetical protein
VLPVWIAADAVRLALGRRPAGRVREAA